ncbi:MAG TPA: isoprenylcysteine carboxylmethyltransferase family protein [Gemmatimonadaceae bacterium]|jgi:protein-S-isoprenylcysteine O-methyltransferase Ste14|nr:isoprenylcysteine carboxylmethyltransferase family protein [Gemmatimonadaceae bacterium]
MTSISPTATSPACPAEQTLLARLGGWLFRHRGILPVPFIVVPFIWHGTMAPSTWLFGTLFVAFGESLRLWGVAAAGSETRRRSRVVARLVTHGPFSWLRNPLYFGNFFIWTGFSVIAGLNWFLPIAVAVFALEYTPIVRYEEAVLETTFGEEYLRYKGCTRRWLPVAPASDRKGSLCWKTAWRSERSTLIQFVVLASVLAISHVVR